MKTITEFNEVIATLGAEIDRIAARTGGPNAGGLTEAETTELFQSLTALVTKAKNHQ